MLRTAGVLAGWPGGVPPPPTAHTIARDGTDHAHDVVRISELGREECRGRRRRRGAAGDPRSARSRSRSRCARRAMTSISRPGFCSASRSCAIAGDIASIRHWGSPNVVRVDLRDGVQRRSAAVAAALLLDVFLRRLRQDVDRRVARADLGDRVGHACGARGDRRAAGETARAAEGVRRHRRRFTPPGSSPRTARCCDCARTWDGTTRSTR